MKNMFKKAMTLVISSVMALCIANFSILAIDNEGISDKVISEAEVQRMIEEGQALLKQKAYIQLAVPKYYQNRAGDSWINDIMQPAGLTIKHSGCTLTSFTMIHNYFSRTSDTPGMVNKKLGDDACDFNYDPAAAAYGHNFDGVTYCDTYSEYKAVIAQNINNNKPVMVQLNNPKGGWHYVVATGFGGETIMINDPDIYKDYIELAEYIKDGYSVARVLLFTK